MISCSWQACSYVCHYLFQKAFEIPPTMKDTLIENVCLKLVSALTFNAMFNYELSKILCRILLHASTFGTSTL